MQRTNSRNEQILSVYTVILGVDLHRGKVHPFRWICKLALCRDSINKVNVLIGNFVQTKNIWQSYNLLAHDNDDWFRWLSFYMPWSLLLLLLRGFAAFD